jgi:tetratricopeptide (TPR) repeat protein
MMRCVTFTTLTNLLKSSQMNMLVRVVFMSGLAVNLFSSTLQNYLEKIFGTAYHPLTLMTGLLVVLLYIISVIRQRTIHTQTQSVSQPDRDNTNYPRKYPVSGTLKYLLQITLFQSQLEKTAMLNGVVNVLTLSLVTVSTAFVLAGVETQEPCMSGDIRIAVATLVASESALKDQARSISLSMEKRILDGLQLSNLSIEIRGPRQLERSSLGEISDDNALAVSTKFCADLVVYGELVEDASKLEIQPKVYINSHEAFRLSELNGVFVFGAPIRINKRLGISDRVEINDALVARTDILIETVIGHDYYRSRNYEKAIEHFSNALGKVDDTDMLSKQMFLLWVAMTEQKLAVESSGETRKTLILKSLSRVELALINHKSPRAYLVKGQAYYLLALADDSSVDQKSLSIAMESFKKARDDSSLDLNDPYDLYVRSISEIANAQTVSWYLSSETDKRNAAEETYRWITAEYQRRTGITRTRIADVAVNAKVQLAGFYADGDNNYTLAREELEAAKEIIGDSNDPLLSRIEHQILILPKK